jgi:uncharacterized protein YqfA (UPF0365 family)
MKKLRERKIISVSPNIILLALVALVIFIIVMPVIIWTTKLATNIKIALTICMAILVLIAIISMALKGLVYGASKDIEPDTDDESSTTGSNLT